MIDRSSPPANLEDSQVDVNPYELTDKIEDLVGHYFTTKYDVEFTEIFPSKEVTRNTIVAMTVLRTPGREGSKVNGKGHNFLSYLKTTPDGYIHERHVQQQELILEYSVYSISTAEVKRIAWDLERAILETVGVLQRMIPGFQMVFEKETPNSSMLMRQQDELIKRTIRFRVLLPIMFIKVAPELRHIDKTMTWSSVSTGKVMTRTSSSKIQSLSVETTKKINHIRMVYVKTESYPIQWEALIGGTDYLVKKDKDMIPYIEWNDEFGKVPAVGDEFRVDFDLAAIINSSSVKSQ